ncbi:hypothetical protein GCM10027289_11150 [Tsukamurella serpentis]
MHQVQSADRFVAPGRFDRSQWPSTGAVLLAESAAGGAALGLAAAGAPHWAAAAAALLVGSGALARYRSASTAERLAARLTVRRERRTGVEAAPRSGGGEIGVRRTDRLLTCLIRIAPSRPEVVSLLAPQQGGLPLERIAHLLQHTDTPLSRIDVLITGGRAPGTAVRPLLRYQQLLGPLARWSAAEVLLAVTVDPQACAAACGRRGGGPQAQLRVAALAAQRTVDVLREAGMTASPLRPDQVAAEHIWAPPEAQYADPGAVAQGDLRHLLTEGGSGRAAISVRADGDHRVRVGAWRLPAGDETRPPRRTGREVSGVVGALSCLEIPVAGCGQVLGGDTAGNPVAVRLHGPGVRTVWAAVADDPALQLVERAVATGARVLVVTGRPAMWEPLVSWVGSPHDLWISGWRYPDGAAVDTGRYTVTVLDGTASGLTPGSVEPSGTVWRIEAPRISPVAEADVVLSQPQPGMLTVRTDGGAATVRLVA